MSLSGLGLVLFTFTHLLGNLFLFDSTGRSFNKYAESLHNLGLLLIVAEVGLVATFLIHIFAAINLTFLKRKARPVGYEVVQSKEGPSMGNISSRNMIITGLVLLVFLVVHLIQFKFGPGVEEGYVTTVWQKGQADSMGHTPAVHGQEARDLYRLVVEKFQNPWIAFGYVAVMIFLGFHLRHGFWSAFQSLGLMNPKLKYPVYGLGIFIALLLAIGFLSIPVWIYFVN